MKDLLITRRPSMCLPNFVHARRKETLNRAAFAKWQVLSNEIQIFAVCLTNMQCGDTDPMWFSHVGLELRYNISRPVVLF